MISFNSFLSLVYRFGLFLQSAGRFIAWVAGGIKVFLVYTAGVLWPQRKQLAILVLAVGGFAAFMHFVVTPISIWMEDRAMMKNPIIAQSGQDFLIDGRKVIKYQEIGRISLSDWSGGGVSIDTHYPEPIDQPSSLIVCANSAFQNECPRLQLNGTLSLIDYDSPEKGPYGIITYMSDKKSGNTYILIKITRPMNTLPQNQ